MICIYQRRPCADGAWPTQHSGLRLLPGPWYHDVHMAVELGQPSITLGFS